MTANARIYDLEQPRYFGAPVFPSHAPGYVYTLHRHHERGMGEARTGASGFMYTTEHSGTHIDALCHQAEDLYLYGGREVDARIQTASGFTELGGETIAPIVTRGVLLDAAAYRWLASRGVKAVGADNMAWDEVGVVDPELKVSLPGHVILLVRHGIYIIENLFLEDIARDQCYEFTFICLPLKMRGATGSPVRPVAMVNGG